MRYFNAGSPGAAQSVFNANVPLKFQGNSIVRFAVNQSTSTDNLMRGGKARRIQARHGDVPTRASRHLSEDIR
jgi:hypothetical protein